MMPRRHVKITYLPGFTRKGVIFENQFKKENNILTVDQYEGTASYKVVFRLGVVPSSAGGQMHPITRQRQRESVSLL